MRKKIYGTDNLPDSKPDTNFPEVSVINWMLSKLQTFTLLKTSLRK